MDQSPRHRGVAWLAIAGLLFLRIPFTIFLIYAPPGDRPWAPVFFQLGTYFLTAFLIWWEREDLSKVHIDTLALAIIILFKPAQTLILRYLGVDTTLTFPNPVGVLVWVIAIGLVIALWRSGFRPEPVRASDWGWLSFGLLVGFVLSALPNMDVFHSSLRAESPPYVTLPTVAASTGITFLYQIGFAAVTEEPLFRGFLWGYLRRLGGREIWAWLVQAALFMSAHVYFIEALHFNFWVAVPGGALIFGLLAWRSRSIVPGMMAHAAYNAGVYIILVRLLNSFG